MSPRYLLVVGPEGAGRSELIRRLRSRTGLRLLFANNKLAALGNGSCSCLVVGEQGCILGYLFPRHGQARLATALDEGSAAAIAATEGRSLLDTHWGAYIAALSAGEVSVMRDPSGNFPCYYSAHRDWTLFAADAEILISATGGQASIDLEAIGKQAFGAFVPAPGTAIRGIAELLAGFMLRVPGSQGRQQACWSPWVHVEPSGATPDELAEQLRRTIQHCIHGWASTERRILLSVSGGLDSSIVAACLARTGADASCLTMYTEDPGGDERPFARILCGRLGLPLVERPYRLSDVDIDQPLAAHLPRPKDRTQAVAYERVHRIVAEELGATAFMTGNGGDHVFNFSQSAAPIADRYLAGGFGTEMIAPLRDICRQTGCSAADALRHAWRLARAPRGYRVRPNLLFLARDFTATLRPDDLHHPWLDAPPDALPGKSAHVAAILRVQPALEPVEPGRAVLNPLVSQPIIEACLAIPSWEWRAGGMDRSVARRAFAAQLPPLILGRRNKGSPGRFAAALLDHFRSGIRGRLLGGRLAASGIVDAAAIEQALANDRPVADLERVRLLELVNAEAWIRCWETRGMPAEPGRSSPDAAAAPRREARPTP